MMSWQKLDCLAGSNAKSSKQQMGRTASIRFLPIDSGAKPLVSEWSQITPPPGPRTICIRLPSAKSPSRAIPTGKLGWAADAAIQKRSTLITRAHNSSASAWARFGSVMKLHSAHTRACDTSTVAKCLQKIFGGLVQFYRPALPLAAIVKFYARDGQKYGLPVCKGV